MAVSTMLIDMGFDNVERQCLETLCEMFQSCKFNLNFQFSSLFSKNPFISVLFEIGQSSRSYCELASRTTPVIGDVILALINMGLSVKGLEAFGRKMGALPPVPTPQQVAPTKNNSLLAAGKKQFLPSYIPNHFPALPDPHAYIRTPTHKQPVTEYEAIRERAATQKRDVEKALTKFLAKTSETHSLFPDVDEANQMFPLIACKPAFPAYLAALNPTDQVFDFEELEYHYQVANRTEDETEKDVDEDEDGEGHDESKELDLKAEATGKGHEEDMDMQQDMVVDNPFLKAQGT